MRINLWAAAGLAAALAGCNNNKGDPAEGGGESTGAEALEIYDFFIAAETSYCGWAAKCGAYASADECMAVEFFDVLFPADLLAAGTFHRGSGGSLVAYLLQSFEAGRIEFDAEAAAACLAYVEGRGCDRPYAYVAGEEELAGRKACASVFRGTMTRNGPCLLSMECAHAEGETATCGIDPNSCVDSCCVGGCRVLIPAAIGEPCNNTTGCVTGSFCAQDPNTGAPTVCIKHKAIGQACQNFNECDASGYCDFINGKCAKKAGAGASCWDAQCEDGTYCGDISPNFESDLRCLKYGAVGETCGRYSNGCRSLTAVCDGDNLKCVELPKAGSPCSQWSNDGDNCAPGAYCDYNKYICNDRVGQGEACGWIGDDFNGMNVECNGALLCYGDPSPRCEVPVATSTCAVPELQPLPGEG